jgi:hypothetical protein
LCDESVPGLPVALIVQVVALLLVVAGVWLSMPAGLALIVCGLILLFVGWRVAVEDGDR